VLTSSHQLNGRSSQAIIAHITAFATKTCASKLDQPFEWRNTAFLISPRYSNNALSNAATDIARASPAWVPA